MKKSLMFLLQLLSLFLFIAIIVGTFIVIKGAISHSKEGAAYVIGYSLAGIATMGLLLWLTVRLWKFSNKKK